VANAINYPLSRIGAMAPCTILSVTMGLPLVPVGVYPPIMCLPLERSLIIWEPFTGPICGTNRWWTDFSTYGVDNFGKWCYPNIYTWNFADGKIQVRLTSISQADADNWYEGYIGHPVPGHLLINMLRAQFSWHTLGDSYPYTPFNDLWDLPAPPWGYTNNIAPADLMQLYIPYYNFLGDTEIRVIIWTPDYDVADFNIRGTGEYPYPPTRTTYYIDEDGYVDIDLTALVTNEAGENAPGIEIVAVQIEFENWEPNAEGGIFEVDVDYIAFGAK